MECHLVSEEFRLSKLMICRPNKYLFKCDVVFGSNGVHIETRYFKTYTRGFEFAKSRVFPDPDIRISVRIYAIQFEQPEISAELITTVKN